MRATSIRFILLTCWLFGAAIAHAEVTVDNDTLDSTFVFGQGNAAEIVFGDVPPYINLGIEGSDLRTCTLTALDGLYCLDSKMVRNWPDPRTHSESFPVVDCEDTKLGLDRKKPNTCTAMTVGDRKNMFLAGKNKGKTHSLIELVDNSPPECSPSAFQGATLLGALDSNNDLCAYEIASGRPLILDMTTFGDAVLALEGGKTVVAFQSDGEVVEIASGKSDWGLIGPEKLLRISLLQLADSSQEFTLVTTTRGRVLAWDMAGVGPAIPVFNFADNREDSAQVCDSADPVYGISVSGTTNLVYVSDSEYCEVIALEETIDADGLLHATGDYDDATALTDGFVVPTGVTVAPGNVVDLSDCDEACTIDTEEGAVTAKLEGVQLSEDSASGLMIFRVTGIPDCRYFPDHDACVSSAVVPLPGGNADDPATQRLNITELLPDAIKEQFPNELPPLLLAHYVRGQKDNGFIIEGFFGIAQDGVVFRDTFDGVIAVELLADTHLGCDDNEDALLWDVLGTVSERHVSASDTHPAGAAQHVSTVTNINGCGSSRTRGGTWSFKPYNLEPTPCTFNPYPNGVWSGDGKCELPDSEGVRVELADDAVNAKMLLILADEYYRTVNQLACEDAYDENGGSPPLATGDCLAVYEQVVNMIDKLHKCWDATQIPKQSSGDQNCQAFDSQLENLEFLLNGITPQEPDVANRVGELKARAATMRHVFEERFMPSLLGLDDQHFVEPQQ